jgi:glycosyltransferase involved in cell wall biosynthesis
VAAERLRVLVLVDEVGDEVGGAERFAVGVACALPRDRFDVSVCATHAATGDLTADLDRAGVRHFALGRSGRFDMLAFRRLVRYLRRERIQVLHSHKFGSNVWGAVFGALCRVPVVVAHEHTWSYEGRPLRKLLDGKLIGRVADAFVSVSSADRERMIDLEGVPDRKAVTIPTAYVPRPPAPQGDLRAELGIPAGAVVGTMAQLRPQKALTVLIEAFSGLAARRQPAHLVIVGGGPCLDELREAADRSGVSARVHFPGPRSDLHTVLAALDVAAMSSDFEGTPLFAFECMAAGTPLVATAVGGLPDLLGDGRSAVLVPRRDPAALATAIERLLSAPDERRALAGAAARRLEHYGIDAVAGRFARLYGELLERRR